MKIIDLLNKIANGEEVPKAVNSATGSICYYLYDKCGEQCDDRDLYKILNDEIEIIEEEKKIPEKLPYYSMEKIQKAKNKDEWREERISLLEKRVEDLHVKMNDVIDYLKAKESKYE